MGVYPMLDDETCWFLAVDFDKSTWMDDVRAFVETCRRVGLPAAVERSRSGNGAHVWFFFSAPVAAAIARKMGCYLITETMARRHELSMDSYDRLFPSQDTMPRGGFGNLIALPLQHEPRQQGTRSSSTTSSKPFPDDQQWAYLASVRRIDRWHGRADRARGDARGIRRRCSARGGGGRRGRRAVDAARLPGSRSRRSSRSRCRPRVRAVLAQRLFVEKAGLPSPLLNQIKRLAAFQNPEFYKKQSMRLSTATDPAGDRVRRGSAAARRAAARLPDRARGAAARARCRARRRGRARHRGAAHVPIPREADAGSAGRP